MQIGKRVFVSWAFYDWANSAFSAIIQTFIFAAYFTEQVASDPVLGAALWGWLNGAAAFFIGVGGPILGAIADQGGGRKWWLAFFTGLCVLCTGLLWFVTPDTPKIPLALFLVGMAIVASELAFVFYNALLPSLSESSQIGRWSGWGWAFGYAGGMLSLIFSLLLFIFPYGTEPNGLSIRATFLFCAGWYCLFSIPLFLFVPDVQKVKSEGVMAIRSGMKQLKNTLLELRSYREIIKFLIARIFYVDGLTTLFAFGGVFAAHAFALNQEEILFFGIGMHISAGIGATLFAWFDDSFGAKPLIILSLSGLMVFTLLLLFTHTVTLFWIFGLLLGIFVGPCQSASRSLMARLAPSFLRNEMFGFFALSGKATGFLGPSLVGWMIYITGSQRIGLSFLAALFAIGILVMFSVKEPE